MNWEVILIGLIAASIPGILSLLQNHNKTQAEARLVDAQTEAAEAQKDNLNADTQNKIIGALQAETCQLRLELVEIRARLLLAETRASIAETRSLDYEKKFDTARGDIVKLGEELVRERRDSQNRINKIALLVSRLITQVRGLGGSPEISSDESDILDKLVIVGG